MLLPILILTGFMALLAFAALYLASRILPGRDEYSPDAPGDQPHLPRGACND